MFPHTAHVESMAVFEWDPEWVAPAEPVALVEDSSDGAPQVDPDSIDEGGDEH